MAKDLFSRVIQKKPVEDTKFDSWLNAKTSAEKKEFYKNPELFLNKETLETTKQLKKLEDSKIPGVDDSDITKEINNLNKKLTDLQQFTIAATENAKQSSIFSSFMEDEKPEDALRNSFSEKQKKEYDDKIKTTHPSQRLSIALEIAKSEKGSKMAANLITATNKLTDKNASKNEKEAALYTLSKHEEGHPVYYDEVLKNLNKSSKKGSPEKIMQEEVKAMAKGHKNTLGYLLFNGQ